MLTRFCWYVWHREQANGPKCGSYRFAMRVTVVRAEHVRPFGFLSCDVAVTSSEVINCLYFFWGEKTNQRLRMVVFSPFSPPLDVMLEFVSPGSLPKQSTTL